MDKDILFDNWNIQKKNLEKRDITNISPRIGEIWIVKLGKNLGSEQDGNYEELKFYRLVLVIRTFSKTEIITVIPLTTKFKKIYPYFSLLKEKYNFLNQDSYCLLYQIRTISRKRFLKVLGKMTDSDFNKIVLMLKEMFLYKK